MYASAIHVALDHVYTRLAKSNALLQKLCRFCEANVDEFQLFLG